MDSVQSVDYLVIMITDHALLKLDISLSLNRKDPLWKCDVLLPQTMVFVIQSLMCYSPRQGFLWCNRYNLSIPSLSIINQLKYRKDHRDISTQAWTCFGSASGFSERTNHSRCYCVACDARLTFLGGALQALALAARRVRKEGPQGRNGTLGTPLCCVDVEHKTVCLL